MVSLTANNQLIDKLAMTGLIAKGAVYVLLGILAFMAAFEIGGQSNNKATQTGSMEFLKNLPGGTVLLLILTAGLFCYGLWRIIQAWQADGKVFKKLRYAFSALAYLALAYTALRMFLGEKSGADKNQSVAGDLMAQPLGQWLVGLAALILLAVGVYQIYYGISEKYKKHVQKLRSQNAGLLLRMGKIGYISRGIVWLVISFLFIKAALHAASSEAGGTGKAFRFIEASPFGSYLLGALGLGLMAYGIFNFVRARYETFS